VGTALKIFHKEYSRYGLERGIYRRVRRTGTDERVMFIVYGGVAFTACLWNAAGGKPVPVSCAGAFYGLAPGSILCVFYLRDEPVVLRK
jgi:hypothetical protein